MLQLFIDRDPQCLKDLRRGVMTSPALALNPFD